MIYKLAKVILRNKAPLYTQVGSILKMTPESCCKIFFCEIFNLISKWQRKMFQALKCAFYDTLMHGPFLHIISYIVKKD